MRRPTPARSVPDAVLLGFQRACVRAGLVVVAATAAGIGWHQPHKPHPPIPAQVVETCPCPAAEPGSWPLRSR